VQRLDVRLLGGFRVEVDSREVPDDAWKHGRATQLVKLLSLTPHHRLDRDRVIEALWPHLEPDAGAANLHKAASYARKALGARDAVVLRGGRVELAPDAEVSTDVERLESGDDVAVGDELLPDDRYEEWTIEPRERLRARRLAVLRDRGDWDGILAEDPTNEEAHRALMRAEADAGDRAAAVRRYRHLRDELAALGLTPETATTRLWAEISRGPAVQLVPVHQQRLIGRAAESRLLRRALDRAERGRGGLVAIVGEPGIGKTRLSEFVLRSAADSDWHVIRGAPRPGEGVTPYGPVIEALEALVQERPDLAGQLSPAGAATLEALRQPGRGIDDGASIAPHEVAATVAELLGSAARERGLLLHLDDMHEADDASIRLTGYLARSAADSRLLIVACLRPTEREPAAELPSDLAREGIGIELVLEPIDRAAVEELAQEVARRPLPAETLDAIAASAAGNPFYVEELAATIDQAGDISVPRHLREVLDAHFDGLDDAAVRLLPAIVVLENPFDAADVADLASVSPAEARPTLSEMARARVLTTEGDDRFSFRHPLLREAAREQVPDARLAETHAELASRLAAADAPPERIAFHMVRAGKPRDAVPLLADAARWALDVGAFGEGLAWVEEAAGHADEGQRAGLFPLLAELRHRTGDPRAPAAYDRAAAVATDDQRRVELRVQQVRAYLAIGDLDAAARLIEAIDLERASEADRARMTLARGIAAWHRGDIAEARRLAIEAAALYENAGLTSELGETEDLAAMVAHADGQWTRHVSWRLGEAWELPQVAGRVYDAYLCVTEYVMQSGDSYDELREFAQQLRSHARRAGARRGEAFATTVLGESELLAGDPESARDHLTEAVRISREVRATGGEAVARARLAEASLMLGDREFASMQVEEALALAYHSPMAPHVLPLAHRIAIGIPEDVNGAMALLERAESVLDPATMCPFCRVGYYVAAARACCAAGDVERGWDFVERADRGVALWISGTPWKAAVAQARAELLLAEQRVPEAAASLRRAAEGFADAGQRVNERLAREALASVS
jgi:DNA-binding SARP family transcriptional activator